MPARCQASSNTRVWAAGLGAVSPLVRPSLLIALARITPWIGSPAARAAGNGRSRATPTPSLGTKPSARSSKARQRPLGASTNLGKRLEILQPQIELHPPGEGELAFTTAGWLSIARCTATSELLQAVSTGQLGPCKSRK